MHRRLGSIWLGLMVTTAIASFWIRGESGAFSGIHLFSIGTLIAVPMAIWRVRVRDIRAHQQIMVSLYVGLIVAGAFALDPNRVEGNLCGGFYRTAERRRNANPPLGSRIRPTSAFGDLTDSATIRHWRQLTARTLRSPDKKLPQSMRREGRRQKSSRNTAGRTFARAPVRAADDPT